jgi:hypothetical protein
LGVEEGVVYGVEEFNMRIKIDSRDGLCWELYRELDWELNRKLRMELIEELYWELRRELYRELNMELRMELRSYYEN